MAVDGTPSGRDAVALGSQLTGASGAEAMLIAVHEEPLVQVVLPSEMSWSTLEKQTWTMLAATRDALAPHARIVVEADALVWRALRRVVRREHQDLLVVGSAHSTEDGRVQLGRSGGDLLGHLECPLAIAPSGLRHAARKKLELIGVGFDGGSESRAALGLAASIASATGAKLEVRSAVDDRVSGGLSTEHVDVAGDTIIAPRVVSAFERDVAAASATDVPTQVDVRVGIPADILLELGDRADLLVVGSGRTARPGRVALGGTGRALLHGAPCPVLVVPRPAETG